MALTYCGFLKLPVELRYQVYGELFAAFLTDCQATDIKGVFLSCRQIHQEMDYEYVRQARPLLNIMRSWKETWKDAGFLDLQLANSNNFEESMQISAITVQAKLFPKYSRETGPAEPDPNMLDFLRRVCRHTHRTLTLRNADRALAIGLRTVSLNKLDWLIQHAQSYDDATDVFAHVERFVLEPTPSQNKFSRTNDSLNRDLRWLATIFEESGFPAIKRTWASKVLLGERNARFSYGFDFKEGLPEVEGTEVVNEL
jgi:hypothetical protein